MTEYLLLAHWLTTFFLLLVWCIEKIAHRWTGYRFIYRLYAGLPLLLCLTILMQANAPLTRVPDIMASLSVANTAPVVVIRHVNILQWIWIAGVAFVLAGVVREWRTLARLSGERIKLGAMDALIAKEINGPCLKGFLRPVILLPENYRKKFDAGQLELIVAHERVHARRMDNLWNVIAFGIRAIFWFNPLVWFGYHRFRLVQELSCDETVLANQPANVSLAYARALLAASAFQHAKQPLCTYYGDKEMMLQRMHCIKTAGRISKGVQRLVLCMALMISGSFAAIAATDVSSGDAGPVRKTTVQPKYPPAAIEAKAEAGVILEFDIDANEGRPFDIRVVENTGPEAYREDFNQAAIDSLKQWRWEPSGRVQTDVRSKIGFKLGK
ncbi:M56 family metallopeptidase [uncultured Microbulbifer sp.]|mgnify:CR=1 FL=1|uniref:M56 family metallopeptidase n=1 Tax=uncultured Microbulbifer sp. TaxID=348147 RepID=UPI0025ED4492|nr:M56 family metallopeptidase [uncultured Microbulbifer sp.]